MEAAKGLIVRKGYEAMSIQDVLDQVGASKGAFYHYFDSKQALLIAVSDDMTDTVLALVEPIHRNPARPAPEKLNLFFSSVSQWKTERSDLMFELIEVWVSDANALVREHLRKSVTARLTPIVADILAQGIAEGTVTTTDPEHTASVFLSLLLATQETTVRLLLGHRDGSISLDEVERTLLAHVAAFERVLGVPHGSIGLIDRPTLEFWFAGPAQSERKSAA